MPAGRRGDDQPALGGPVVMYEAGKILKVGGATWNGNTPASAGAYLIDTTSAVSPQATLIQVPARMLGVYDQNSPMTRCPAPGGPRPPGA